MATDSLQPDYFDHIYEQNNDPWDFATSDYERNKYKVTLENLPKLRYRNGFEIGCSIGVLTALLASRCDHLLSIDVSERALAQARARCAALPHVSFTLMQIPDQMPADSFDLIVASEVGYYLQISDLERAASKLAECHAMGGTLMLVHLTEFVPDYPLTGDQVHDYWIARPEWTLVHHLRHTRFRLDVLERVPAPRSSLSASR